MDPLADLLNGARARGALLHQTVLEPPWSMRIADGAPLALVAMARGRAWIVPDEGEPTPVGAGDVAIVCGTAPYTVADDPLTPPQIVVHAGARCTTPDGSDLDSDIRLGPRTCGLGDAGSALLLSGTYPMQGDVSARLLDVLPRVLVVSHAEARDGVMALLLDEIEKDEPGQQFVLDRLLDLALIATLRAWFARPDARAPGWYRAQSDPLVGPALRLMHDRPAYPWTVAEIAEKVGSSRAALARRFAELVGEPPMTYLTRWRIALAADLLRDTDATLESIAGQVGYANAFALSVAFKRLRGVSPAAYRTGHADTPADPVAAPR